MLERNNGLTFRAKEVSIQDNHVILKRGALINGCQTTMCLNKNSEFANLCNIQIKIIEKSDEDSWDVAKSSNFQNEITRMDLELAKYIRPQIFRKTAADFGYNVETVSENPKDILHSIYKEKINYDTVKLLYVGFFSDDASQVFEKKYNKIRFDILNKLENTSEREDIFKAIFLLSIEIHRCSEQTRDKIRKNQEQFRVDIFDRLFDESKYIAFMGILLSSVLVRKNFYAINNIQETVDFFNKLQDVFINNKVKIITDYKECYKMIASLITHKSEGESDLLRYMHRRIKETKFSEHYRMVMTQKALNDTLE
jgi:hypothetical protein